MEKLADIFKLFRQGEAVSNGEAWKTGQITATAIAGVLLAAVKLLSDFDFALPIDQNSALAIGGGFLAVFNIGLSIVTSKNHGLPASSSTNGNSGQ